MLRTTLSRDRAAPTPTPPSGRAGRPSLKARRAARRLRKDASGVLPSRPAGGERSGESAALLGQPDGGRKAGTIWLFDLDNTLHDASNASFPQMHAAIGDYMATHLGVSQTEASALRERYWRRYGATMLGLVRHHDVRAAHFLAETHRMPGLEQRVRMSLHDRAAIARLPGRRFILTNAPRAYALRVLDALGLTPLFEAVITIEDMTMFGSLRPKPDARMLRRVAARLAVPPSRCVLVEDTLANLKAARSVGMRGVWMQRYLGGRFRGHLAGAVTSASHAASPRLRSCPKPAYLHAKIGALRTLIRRR